MTSAEEHFEFLRQLLAQYEQEPTQREEWWFIQGFNHGVKHGKEEKAANKK